MRQNLHLYGKIFVVLFVFSFSLSGCSLKEKISQTLLSTLEKTGRKVSEEEDGDSNSKVKKENLKKGINGNTLEQLQQLEELAVKYKELNSSVEDSAALLVVKYLRSQNPHYTTVEWNILAGMPDENFADYVEKEADEELRSLGEKVRIVDPGTGEEIEFSHLIASINLAVVQKEGVNFKEFNNNRFLVNYGSWVGDLLQLCTEIQGEELSSSMWFEEMTERIGNENSSFNREDLYADLDACNLEKIFEPSKGIAIAFYEYYYEILEKSSMTRYQYFCENHFQGAEDVETLSNQLSDIVLDETSMVMQGLLVMEGLDIDSDADLISTACDAFAQKVIEQKNDFEE